VVGEPDSDETVFPPQLKKHFAEHYKVVLSSAEESPHRGRNLEALVMRGLKPDLWYIDEEPERTNFNRYVHLFGCTEIISLRATKDKLYARLASRMRIGERPRVLNMDVDDVSSEGWYYADDDIDLLKSERDVQRFLERVQREWPEGFEEDIDPGWSRWARNEDALWPMMFERARNGNFFKSGDERRKWQRAHAYLMEGENDAINTPLQRNPCHARQSHTLQVDEVSFEMVLVEEGAFWMCAADDDEDADESPKHEVHLSSYQISQTQVTQELYKAVMGKNKLFRRASSEHPVNNVNWFDAVRFCNALSKKCGLGVVYTIGKGKTPKVTCDFNAHGFRLPTEAEWECAAKAGRDFKYSGSDVPNEVAWYEGNSDEKAHPVAQKKANAWGLYDMSGNVYEWCWDWVDGHANRVGLSGDKPTIITNPTGPINGVYRSLRGGCFLDYARFLSVTCSNKFQPKSRDVFFGFRLVLPYRP
jgi:formylglycine-generating enzyme required for sulfatase activity